MFNKKAKIIIPLFLVFLFFVPFFKNPIDINIHPDNAIELLDILRLSDSRLTFSLNPSAIYANPIFQILSDDHGAMRSIIFWPIFTALDLAHIPINEPAVTSTYLAVGFLIFAGAWLFLRKTIGEKKAFSFFILICSMPYIMMQIKFGWWQTYAWLPFIAGFYFLNDYLKNKKANSFIFFCLTSCLYILTTPGFFFGAIFYIVYGLVFLRTNLKSWKNVALECLKIFKTPWTWLPILLIIAEIAAVYIARIKFGYGFGIMLKILSKSDLTQSYGWKTITSFLLSGFGLAGFVLWPAIFAAYIKSLVDFKKSDPILKSCTIFFSVTFSLLIFIAMGSSAYSYELYFPGLIMLVYAITSLKNKNVKIFIVSLLVVAGLTQGILYNSNFKPNNFLDDKKYFIERDNNVPDACHALWCPYHFEDVRNTGLKTLGFVIRNYLSASPKPYVSQYKNFEEWPKEIFFYQVSSQAPTIHIGRRINTKIELIKDAKIIISYTPEALVKYPVLANQETSKKITDFIKENRAYKHEAAITINGVPMINIYELNGTKSFQEFPVEIYDKLFDEKYSNLKNLGHIDLGNI